MFYCTPCADDKEWPTTLVTSLGKCEICGAHGECNNRPSRLLPLPKPARAKDRIDSFLELFTEAERASWSGGDGKAPNWVVQGVAYFLGEEPANKELMKRLKESGD